jgi:ubiquinone/menaquinone biosynthesis C-methylase UbiE
MVLATETEIQDAYRGEKTASGYVRARFATPLNRLLHDRQVRAVQRLMRRVRPASILEIAPGPGRITRDVRPSGKLVCLEYNEDMIAQGQAACGDRAVWVRGNAFQLPFDPRFDLVYSFRFVRHFHRADRDRLYSEIRRVLRPGGYFLMDAVNARVSRPLREANPEQYPVYDKLHDGQELREELAGAGLEPVALEPVHKFYAWQYRSQVLLGPRADWLNRLLIRALESLPAGDGLEWIVTCRRA